MEEFQYNFAFTLRHEEKLTGRLNYMNWSICLKTMLRDKGVYEGTVQDPAPLGGADDVTI